MSMTGLLGGGAGESGSAHHQRLETSTAAPLGGSAKKSGSAHHQRLETLTAGLLRGVGAGHLGAPTINAKKRRRRASW
jgi:hypothetical protein